jgi:biopolymer transport protein ExbD
VQLPEAQGEEIPAEEPEMIRLVIDRAGPFYVNDRAVVDRKAETLVEAI